MSEPESNSETQDRRGFVKKAAAVLLGGILSLFAPLTGLVVFLDPLWRRGRQGEDFIRITSLDNLSKDGVPRRFSVYSDKVDAWNSFPNTPVGAVFLRRTSEVDVVAFNVVCPHLGCAVDHRGSNFFCPCHNSTFAFDGSINDPDSPSPRDMDSLDVEIRDGDVWVRFQNFRTGESEKFPVA